MNENDPLFKTSQKALNHIAGLTDKVSLDDQVTMIGFLIQQMCISMMVVMAENKSHEPALWIKVLVEGILSSAIEEIKDDDHRAALKKIMIVSNGHEMN